jgi:hypothetical protein
LVQYIESLADLVRQGIEAANDDLRRENEEKLLQEGVMRQLPGVGSLLNWLSPLPPATAHMKGRSFDLKTGRRVRVGASARKHAQAVSAKRASV